MRLIDTLFFALIMSDSESIAEKSTAEKSIAEKLQNALAQCDETEVMEAVEQLLAGGMAADKVVAVCNQGMGLLGERFDSGEAFVPDLMFGGAIMKKAMARLEPLLPKDAAASAGKTLVIGTVQHDVHDIGKDITAMVFRGNGFNVVDLGVNTKPEAFVEAIKKYSPEFVAMSVLLTTCYRSVTETMDLIRASGLRDKVKICIGGAAASALVAEKSGIDFYGETAVDGVNWAKAN